MIEKCMDSGDSSHAGQVFCAADAEKCFIERSKRSGRFDRTARPQKSRSLGNEENFVACKGRALRFPVGNRGRQRNPGRARRGWSQNQACPGPGCHTGYRPWSASLRRRARSFGAAASAGWRGSLRAESEWRPRSKGCCTGVYWCLRRGIGCGVVRRRRRLRFRTGCDEEGRKAAQRDRWFHKAVPWTMCPRFVIHSIASDKV